MKRFKNIVNNLSNEKKISCLVLILIFFLFIIISFPSLAKLKNRNTIVTEAVWNGEVATSYRKGDGTENNPYIISNGSELAYFSNQLQTTNYENTYFELSNDIVLNDGILVYDTANRIQYIKDNITYYIDDYTNNYYDNATKEGQPIGQVNLFDSLNNFKGNFEGNSFIIYGLYITDEQKSELGLFTNLQGSINNLYVENSLIYGGYTTGGVAASATNAAVNNVQYNGYVIGRNIDLEQLNNIDSITLTATQTETVNNMTLTNTSIEGIITGTTLTGEYTLSDTTNSVQIFINNVLVENNTFEIDMGTNLLEQIDIKTITSGSDAEIVLSNLKYNITYTNSTTAGLIATSKGSTINNSINKANVYGNYISGGIIGLESTSGQVSQSYNTGNVTGNYISGGIVGKIDTLDSDLTISKSYNSGNISSSTSGGLLGFVQTTQGQVNINDSFDASSNYTINTIDNSIVNVTNSYNTHDLSINNGNLTTNFSNTTIENLKNKQFLINTLGYNEFVNFNDLESQSNNVWIYENNELPILYIDDIKNPIATINLSIYNWNNLSTKLNTIKLNSNITFSLEDASNLSNTKEKYYYISNSQTPLTLDQLSNINNWVEYNDIVQITTSGYYVIYAKIVDYSDNITYINTDVLALDLTGLLTTISLEDNNWTGYSTNLDTLYINKPTTISINATSDLLNINSVQYYISDTELSKTDLTNISAWQDYVSDIEIIEKGKYVVYAKIIDSSETTTYLNTNYIVYGGYEQSATYGMNSEVSNESYITSKSTINLKFINNTSIDFKAEYTHNIVSNTALPIGTNILLINNTTNKVYKYKILDNSSSNTYSFSLFKEIGSAVPKYYDESIYVDTTIINEDYNIIIDFSETNVIENYDNVKVTLEIKNSSNESILKTIENTVKATNVYSNIFGEETDAKINLTSTYTGQPIYYNSDSISTISINESIINKYMSGNKIVDTTYEDKKLVLALKLVDETGNIVEKEYLNSMIFKIGDNEYFAESDGIIRINSLSEESSINKDITVITKQNNSKLKDGTYYLKIHGYAAYGGYYSNSINSNEISIPIEVLSSGSNLEYSFNVDINEEKNILSKTQSTDVMTFNISQSGNLENPIIGISLYQKASYTAYNQDYNVLDLANYITDDLTKITDNNYLIENTTLNLHLDMSKFENAGYKYIFTLYDGNKIIGTIEKYFIVK